MPLVFLLLLLLEAQLSYPSGQCPCLAHTSSAFPPSQHGTCEIHGFRATCPHHSLVINRYAWSHFVVVLLVTLVTRVQILALRNEKAKLLGFKNYADLSLASKVGGRVRESDCVLKKVVRAYVMFVREEIMCETGCLRTGVHRLC